MAASGPPSALRSRVLSCALNRPRALGEGRIEIHRRMLTLPIVHALRLDLAGLVDEARQGTRLAVPDFEPPEVDALVDARIGLVGEHGHVDGDPLASGMEFQVRGPTESADDTPRELLAPLVVILHDVAPRVVERAHDLRGQMGAVLERGGSDLLRLEGSLGLRELVGWLRGCAAIEGRARHQNHPKALEHSKHRKKSVFRMHVLVMNLKPAFRRCLSGSESLAVAGVKVVMVREPSAGTANALFPKM